MPFSTVISGRVTFVNTNSGMTTHTTLPVGRDKAMFFGTSSPNTICTAVASSSAKTSAANSVTSASSPSASSGRAQQRRDRRLRHQADRQTRDRDTQLSARQIRRQPLQGPRTRPNRTLPSRARDSTRLRSTVTSAVSAATKTAFPTIKTPATPSRIQAVVIA